MNPQTTAIVIIDDNNDFLSEGGKLFPAVKTMLESNDVVANINRVIGEARKKNIAVIHVPIAFSPGYEELGPAPYGIFKAVKEAGALQRGTWGGRVAEVIDLGDDDPVLDGKHSTCAFATTDLEDVLDRRGIKTIALAGLLSNVCIESTMRTAYDSGFEVIALTDCAAALSPEQHDRAVETDWPLHSKPMTSTDFLAGF